MAPSLLILALWNNWPLQFTCQQQSVTPCHKLQLFFFFLKGGEIKVTKGRGYKKGNCPTAKVWVISWDLGFGLTDFQFEFWFGVLLEHSAPTLIYLCSWDCDEVGDNGWGGELAWWQGFSIWFSNLTGRCFISLELWFCVGDILSLLSIGFQMALLGSWLYEHQDPDWGCCLTHDGTFGTYSLAASDTPTGAGLHSYRPALAQVNLSLLRYSCCRMTNCLMPWPPLFKPPWTVSLSPWAEIHLCCLKMLKERRRKEGKTGEKKKGIKYQIFVSWN